MCHSQYILTRIHYSYRSHVVSLVPLSFYLLNINTIWSNKIKNTNQWWIINDVWVFSFKRMFSSKSQCSSIDLFIHSFIFAFSPTYNDKEWSPININFIVTHINIHLVTLSSRCLTFKTSILMTNIMHSFVHDPYTTISNDWTFPLFYMHI